MRKTVNYIMLLLTLAVTVQARAEGEQRLFFSFDASNGLADNSAQTIKCTKTGRMVITTIGHINFYDGDAFTHIDPKPEDLFPLPGYQGHYHLYFDRFHHLWLKDKGAVTCLDLLTERFIQNVDSVIKAMRVKHRVDDMFGDSANRLWFMCGRTLTCKVLDKDIPVIRDQELQDMDVYKDSLLLQFFADGVVAAFELKSGRHLYDMVAYESAADMDRYAESTVLCPDGERYYQIRNGAKESVLLCFDVERRQWQRLMAVPYHLNNMVLHGGKLYVACEYGYWTYDLATGSKEQTRTLMLEQGRRLETDVNTLAFDRQGGMWIGTEKRGLLYASPINTAFTTYAWDQPQAGYYERLMTEALKGAGPLGRHVNCEYRDSRGWLWIGTYTGLQMRRHDGDVPYIYSLKDGLLNEMVHSVIEDNNHDIWIGTSYGISHLFIRNDSVWHVENYNHLDNVPNESFVNGRAIKLDDGTIVMQALDHVVTFNPDFYRNDTVQRMTLLPKLIRLTVNGFEAQPGLEIDDEAILEKSITRTGEFSVDYDHNTLVFTFSGLNYARPLQTYYRFRVKGVYNKWQVASYTMTRKLVSSQGLLRLPLVGLKPGKYEIEVQVSMVPDYWPQEPFVWTLWVEEPWWRSTGIYLGLGIIILALLTGNFYYFNRNTRLRMIRNNEEEEIMKRIRYYKNRCESMLSEVTATTEDAGPEDDTALSKEFIGMMLKILPYMNQHKNRHITMRDLAGVTGLEVEQLYTLLSANLYKSPLRLVTMLKQQGYKE